MRKSPLLVDGTPTNPVQSVRDLEISVDADLVMGKMNGNLCFCTCVRITTAFQTDLAWTIYMKTSFWSVFRHTLYLFFVDFSRF